MAEATAMRENDGLFREARNVYNGEVTFKNMYITCVRADESLSRNGPTGNRA